MDGINISWLREMLEDLEKIERPSASDGERQAAEWLKERFGELGIEARIEAESAHGTYWWPLGIGAAFGAIASLLTLGSSRGPGRVVFRLAGAALGALGAIGIASDFPPYGRLFRRFLPRRTTHNVIAEIGPADADRTVVLIAHHDAAHGGLVFHQSLPRIADRVGFIQRSNTSPPLMAPVVGGPALASVAAATGSRTLAKCALALSTGSVLAMADIGARPVVPGANDNGTAVVALPAIAKLLLESPPERTRVILLSAGAEESFSEGAAAFGSRHFADLPTESTFFCCIDTVGSPYLCVLRGEGFLKMRDYPQPALDLIDGLADEKGIYLYPNLRLHNGTDGMIPLAAGYQTVALCSVNEMKQPANYHNERDVSENVDFDSVADAIELTDALIRRLDEQWLSASAAAPAPSAYSGG